MTHLWPEFGAKLLLLHLYNLRYLTALCFLLLEGRNFPFSYIYLYIYISCLFMFKYININIFFIYLFLKFIYFIYLFLAALGLRCCAWAFFSCGKRGLLLVAVRRLLIAVASLIVEHGL